MSGEESDEGPQPSGSEGLYPWLKISIITVAVLVFSLVWWLLPVLLYAAIIDEATRVKAFTDTRTALLAGLVGLGALGTFWMNSRNVALTATTIKVSEKNYRLAERSQMQSFELTERGHLTDRYTKAIEQLGSTTLDIRLGGIYALEQIAKDSARGEEDQATIVEVLSAFVRVHSEPVYQYRASRPAAVTDTTGANDDELIETATAYGAKRTKPPVDVQAAVTVLGRLPARPGVSRGDLAQANLPGVDLSRANLTEANLNGANLRGASLVESNLSAANLGGANLRSASSSPPTDLLLARFSAFPTSTAFPTATLKGAYLHKADLTGARLDGTDLTDAMLVETNLTGAELRLANLTNSKLHGADLTGVALYEANLFGARLERANLTGTDLRYLDLTHAQDLSQGQLDSARGNKDTMLPPDLVHPKSWLRGVAPDAVE